MVATRRVVGPSSSGLPWKGTGGGRTTHHRSQRTAIDAARTKVRQSGGGEVTIQGEDGKFREGLTIPKGNDPHPPKG
jgi:hypothetical protein